MSQYVKRKRRKSSRRHVKKGFILFSVICLVLVAAAIFVSVKFIFGDGSAASSGSLPADSSSTDSQASSSEESSSCFAPDTSKLPQSSNISYTSVNVGSSLTADPLGGNYLNVGNSYICEVVSWEAETFDGRTTDDNSKPTNTPLPVGTVDYCLGTIVDNGLGTGETNYRNWSTLRCGKRVYYESLHQQRSKIYNTSDYGVLPETNNVRILSGRNEGQYTVMKLAVDWKAPFTVNIAPQAYKSTSDSSRDYTVNAVTYRYIDITFCYSAKESIGDISEFDFSGTIFSSAEWIKNTSDYTLRLNLKKTGGFYGWSAEYDENDNLVFKFLNPKAVTVSENGSVNLNNAKIYIDVGHGGKDSGAVGAGNVYESERNLALAKALKTRLEEMGAVVKLSRETDTYMEAYDSMQGLRNADADLAICIHHDSGGSGSNGFGSFYYNVFSSFAANAIRNSTAKASIYQQTAEVRWHYYFTARVAHCPVVLTENGFMSNSRDLELIKDNGKLSARANAIADGVAEYFKSIQ